MLLFLSLYFFVVVDGVGSMIGGLAASVSLCSRRACSRLVVGFVCLGVFVFGRS